MLTPRASLTLITILGLSACGSPPPLEIPEPQCQGVNCTPEDNNPSNNQPNNNPNNLNNIPGDDMSIRDECFAGATRCVDAQQSQTCVQDESGTYWALAERCPAGACVGDSCCASSCQPGTKVCTGAGVQTCEMDESGCSAYGPAQACPGGSSCNATGECVSSCQSTCQPGNIQCFPEGSPAYRVCAEFEPGCYKWDSDERQCQGGAACLLGICLPACVHECSSGELGNKRCDGTTQKTCQANAAGCRKWASTGTCQVSNKRSCDSATLGRVVPHNSCVQVNYNWANCAAGCGWGICNDGFWYCYKGALSACDANNTYRHNACR